MAEKLTVFQGRSCRQMGDARINPAEGIGYIRTVYWNPLPKKEIFGDRLFNPIRVTLLLLSIPTPISYLPYLARGFNRGLDCGIIAPKKQQREKDDERPTEPCPYVSMAKAKGFWTWDKGWETVNID